MDMTERVNLHIKMFELMVDDFNIDPNIPKELRTLAIATLVTLRDMRKESKEKK